MPLPDERPRPSVANLIGKFETTSQKRGSASSPAGVAGAPGSSTTALLLRKPSSGTEGATSPRAIAQLLSGNDSSADGASAPALNRPQSDNPATPATTQEDAGSGAPVSTPVPTNGRDAANYNDSTQLFISDIQVPDVQEVPPTPLTEQPDASQAAEEPAHIAPAETASQSKKPPVSPKKPATSLAKPTTAKPRPSTATSSTSKPSTLTVVAPKPKPKTGSMGKPPVTTTPRAPRPNSTTSNANTRSSSTVRTPSTTLKPPVPKPPTNPKPASATPTTGSTIARKTATGSGSSLTPGAAPAKKASTSSLRPSAAASSSTAVPGSSAGGAANLRKSASGKPTTSSTSMSTKPATGATSVVRRPTTSSAPSTMTTATAGAKGGVKPRVGLAGAGRVKNPAAAGKATTPVSNQQTAALGGQGKSAAVLTSGTASVASVAAAKPEGEVKAEGEREVPVECSQVVLIELSPEAPHDAPEEHHHGHVEVPASDVGSHESVPTSPLLEGEEVHDSEGSACDDKVASPPVSGSDNEHEHESEHPGEEEYGASQLSEEQQAELLKYDVPALPEPSEKEVAEVAVHPGAEEHLEKVVPPYQPSGLPTGEQVYEEKLEKIERMTDDA